MTLATKIPLKVADEVWIVTAMLHRENPERVDFTIDEIVERTKLEGLTGNFRPGVYVHVVQHSVANRPSNPARYRMLFETTFGRRRLFRTGDPYDSSREGSKTTPPMSVMPYGYDELLIWYRDWCAQTRASRRDADPLLSLAGTGKHLWADEPADAYVRRLREGWH